MFGLMETKMLCDVAREIALAELEAQKKPLEAEHVIFNPPATIVYWSDGTKTVAKCSPQDTFSEEVGFAMSCAKKLFSPYDCFQAQFEHAYRPYLKKKDKKPTAKQTKQEIPTPERPTIPASAGKKSDKKRDEVINLNQLLKKIAGNDSIGVEIEFKQIG